VINVRHDVALELHQNRTCTDVSDDAGLCQRKGDGNAFSPCYGGLGTCRGRVGACDPAGRRVHRGAGRDGGGRHVTPGAVLRCLPVRRKGQFARRRLWLPVHLPAAWCGAQLLHAAGTRHRVQHPSKLTGAGQTIVIIDAFGDPTVTQDLGVEDSTFGLPAANLNVIYPNGQPTFDPTNADEVNWSGEIALDVESAHAIGRPPRLTWSSQER